MKRLDILESNITNFNETNIHKLEEGLISQQENLIENYTNQLLQHNQNNNNNTPNSNIYNESSFSNIRIESEGSPHGNVTAMASSLSPIFSKLAWTLCAKNSDKAVLTTSIEIGGRAAALLGRAAVSSLTPRCRG